MYIFGSRDIRIREGNKENNPSFINVVKIITVSNSVHSMLQTFNFSC